MSRSGRLAAVVIMGGLPGRSISAFRRGDDRRVRSRSPAFGPVSGHAPLGAIRQMTQADRELRVGLTANCGGRSNRELPVGVYRETRVGGTAGGINGEPQVGNSRNH